MAFQVFFVRAERQNLKSQVITGYNTDVEYSGVVYHVQTEDKGLQAPIILSLVYIGGAILAAKRTPYDDLIARGFDEQVLIERLQRQHQLICAAVHTGRIEDLKRMGEHDAAANTASVPAAQTSTAAVPINKDAEESDADDAPFAIKLIDEPELRGGKSAVLRIFATQLLKGVRSPAPNAKIIVKILGTAFRPNIIQSKTDNAGIATVPVSLPEFRAGRAAVLVQAERDGAIVELRRIILPVED